MPDIWWYLNDGGLLQIMFFLFLSKEGDKMKLDLNHAAAEARWADDGRESAHVCSVGTEHSTQHCKHTSLPPTHTALLPLSALYPSSLHCLLPYPSPSSPPPPPPPITWCRVCKEILSQAQHYVSRARKVDEEERELRERQEQEREAIKKKQLEQEVSTTGSA